MAGLDDMWTLAPEEEPESPEITTTSQVGAAMLEAIKDGRLEPAPNRAVHTEFDFKQTWDNYIAELIASGKLPIGFKVD